MSIANYFDDGRDAGFVRSYDLQSARRQLQVSLTLVAVMTLAVLALALMTGFGAKTSGAQPAAARGVEIRVAQS